MKIQLLTPLPVKVPADTNGMLVNVDIDKRLRRHGMGACGDGRVAL
jgi:hypothetical protein